MVSLFFCPLTVPAQPGRVRVPSGPQKMGHLNKVSLFFALSRSRLSRDGCESRPVRKKWVTSTRCPFFFALSRSRLSRDGFEPRPVRKKKGHLNKVSLFFCPLTVPAQPGRVRVPSISPFRVKKPPFKISRFVCIKNHPVGL